MIKITQVLRDKAQVILVVEYSNGEVTKTIRFDAEDITEKLRAFQSLMDRRPTVSEAKEIFISMIREVRSGRQAFLPILPWEDYIGVDLEAS